MRKLALLILAFAAFFSCQRVSVVLTAAQQADTDDQTIRTYLASKGISNYTRTNAGNYVVIDTAQPENAFLRAGNIAFIRYRLWIPTNEHVAADSNTAIFQTAPLRVELGAPNTVIPGWQDGLKLFRNHETGLLLIPSGQAYGSSGSSSGLIGPNQVLVFHINILNVE